MRGGVSLSVHWGAGPEEQQTIVNSVSSLVKNRRKTTEKRRQHQTENRAALDSPIIDSKATTFAAAATAVGNLAGDPTIKQYGEANFRRTVWRKCDHFIDQLQQEQLLLLLPF